MNHKQKNIRKTNGDAKTAESDSKVDTDYTATPASEKSSQPKETEQGLWRYIGGDKYLMPSWSLVDAFLIATNPNLKKGMKVQMPLLREDGVVEAVDVAITNTVMMQYINWSRYEKDVLKERNEILKSSNKEVNDETGKES